MSDKRDAWALTCPACGNVLPWIWGDRYPKPVKGDWIGCGMCNHEWQLGAKAPQESRHP